MPLIDRKHFELALQNIAKHGDTDVFPFPVENHIFFDIPEKVVEVLITMSETFDESIEQGPPVNISGLAPVGYNGFRWATQIDPIWNAYLLGVVLSLADDIEKLRESPNVVFSHRFVHESDHLFTKDGWTKFQLRGKELAKVYSHVVQVDIADFYGRISHHRLENVLRHVDKSRARTKQIIRLLKEFSDGNSYGLPVGGPAARILSELLLHETDYLLRAQVPKFDFIRYADDYRFFVNSLDEAYRVVGYLSEELRENEGLTLQRSKTRVQTSAEYLTASRPTDPRPESAAKFLNLHLYFDPYSPNAEEDYEKLKEQLESFDVLGLLRSELFKGHIDVALVRKLIQTLKHMNAEVQQQAIASLLANMNTLAPILPHVLRAIRDSIDNLEASNREDVYARLREIVESDDRLMKVDVNLGYMIRIFAKHQSPENERLLIWLYNASHGYGGRPNPRIQRDIMLIMARWQVIPWLHAQRKHFRSSHEWVQRAFLIATYEMGDEGRHWRGSQRRRLDPFEGLVLEWAAQKSTTPSWKIPL